MDSNELDIKRPVTMGLIIIFLFFGMLGLWSFIAPLQSAAIAQGVLSVDSQRKTIQHLEGGIIKEIAVTEGQKVNAGDVLVVLDDTQARASLELLSGRLNTTRALEYRLRSERDGHDAVQFSEELLAMSNDDINEIIESQINIFNARKLSIEGQVAILERRVEQFGEEIVGLTGQRDALDEQVRLIDEEIGSNQILVDQGLSGKARLLELQREMAELLGAKSQNLAAIASSRQNIDESRLQITDLQTNNLNDVVQELREVQTTIYDLTEQLRGAQDVLQRKTILATLNGTIVDLQVHTIGGVIAPGQNMMDIVPSGEKIIVEARIDPSDIDVVETGLGANIRLTAYSSRNLLPIDGRVITVSADRLTDDRTSAPYYLARIELTGTIEEDVELYPGMQAEVMVVTGERTVVDYLTWPIRQSFNRALREN